MNNIGSAVKAIRSANTIVVACHVNPDGDAIGSMLGLALGLRSLGKTVECVSADGVPKKYRSLPGADTIKTKHENRAPFDLAIAVDSSNREILGSSFDAFKNAQDILEIDHHEFRRPFGTISLINPYAAAVGEMIYALLKELGVPVVKGIAQNLLTSIVVETDSFKLPGVTPETFRLCAELVNADVDFYALVDMVFWSKTKELALLSGLCMSRCKFLENNSLVWSIVKQTDFESVGGSDEDVDAVADDMRAIRPVRIAVLFREKKDGTFRVSLRSKSNINVAALAEKYKGGGHFDVAGCSIPNTNEAIKDFLTKAKGLLLRS